MKGGPTPTRLLWAASALLGVHLLVSAVSSMRAPSNGFVAHYTASRLVVEGAPAERFYDDAWFEQQVGRFEPGVRDRFWANPPTMSLLVLPLAWAAYPVARAAWISVCLLLLFVTAAWLVRGAELRGAWAPAFLCVAFASSPVRENLAHAQVYLLALALLALVWRGYRRGADPLLGVPLGVLLVTKTWGLVLWPLLAVQRRGRALLWGLGAALAAALATLPWVGATAWRRYATEAAGLTSDPLLAVTAYQTVPGFFRHLLGAGGPAIGAPLAHVPVLADSLPWLALVLLLGAGVRAALRSHTPACVFSGFVLLALVLSPVSSEAHYAMALLPVALLTSEAAARGVPRVAALALLAGALLVAAPYPFRSPALADGWLALAAYPRLYGALLLWGVAMAWSRALTPPGRPSPAARVGRRAGAAGTPGR